MTLTDILTKLDTLDAAIADVKNRVAAKTPEDLSPVAERIDAAVTALNSVE